MQNTIIPVGNGEYKNIIDYIRDELAPDYIGGPEIVNCADYGIPQTRVRLITIFTRSDSGKKYYLKNKTFLPKRTHSQTETEDTERWVTLREAIGSLPPLSAKKGKNQDPSIPWHCVPIMKPDKFWWIQNTPPNETAYNNQCAECGYDKNPRHGMRFVDGRHTYRNDTPIYCQRCGALLPRPTMIDKLTGERRRIKGFDSAYRRMSWDSPAPTLTQNLQVETSDNVFLLRMDSSLTEKQYERLLNNDVPEQKLSFDLDENRSHYPALVNDLVRGDIEMTTCHAEATDRDFDALRKMALIIMNDYAAGIDSPLTEMFEEYVTPGQKSTIMKNFPPEKTSNFLSLRLKALLTLGCDMPRISASFSWVMPLSFINWVIFRMSISVLQNDMS